MQIAYVFCYTLAYLSYLYNVEVPIEKNPAPGDHEFNLKFYRSNVKLIKNIYNLNYARKIWDGFFKLFKSKKMYMYKFT